MSLLRYVPDIAELVNEFKSKRLLDYGCGDGKQYTRERCHVVWGVDMPYCYDATVPGLHIKPLCNFDGVICIGALDEMKADQLVNAAADIAFYAQQWAFIAVGESHKEFDWWQEWLSKYFNSGSRLVLRKIK